MDFRARHTRGELGSENLGLSRQETAGTEHVGMQLRNREDEDETEGCWCLVPSSAMDLLQTLKESLNPWTL